MLYNIIILEPSTIFCVMCDVWLCDHNMCLICDIMLTFNSKPKNENENEKRKEKKSIVFNSDKLL